MEVSVALARDSVGSRMVAENLRRGDTDKHRLHVLVERSPSSRVPSTVVDGQPALLSRTMRGTDCLVLGGNEEEIVGSDMAMHCLVS